MEWLNTIVTLICSLIAAIGGGSILYYKSNRDMKNMEVRLKGVEVDKQKLDIENNHSAAWQKLYNEARNENKDLSEKVDGLYKEQHSLKEKLLELEEQVRKLSLKTCERDNCKRRIRGTECLLAKGTSDVKTNNNSK